MTDGHYRGTATRSSGEHARNTAVPASQACRRIALLLAVPSVIGFGCLLPPLDDLTGGTSDDAGSLGDVAPVARGDASAPCPGHAGPMAVRVGSSCIDSTEVSKKHYLEFLRAIVDGGSPAATPQCAWNGSYEPSTDWPPTPAELEKPVAYIDWCDAYAFCEWGGKRLCGQVGGGALPIGSMQTVTDQWFMACSRDGTRAFPYGDAYKPRACVGLDYGSTAPLAVASVRSCEGGFSGLFDMSGNVYEWIDACDDTSGEGSCVVAGGSFQVGTDRGLACGEGRLSRASRYSDVGFRCCSP